MRDRTGEVSWDSWDSILVENPGRVQPDRFGPPGLSGLFVLFLLGWDGRWLSRKLMSLVGSWGRISCRM